MPFTLTGTILAVNGTGVGVGIAADQSTTYTLHSNALSKTGTGTTGANSNVNPHGVVAGTVTNHGSCGIVSVPPGASYLDICLEYTGTNPAADAEECLVRAFLDVGPRDINIASQWPADFNSAFFNPGASPAVDWRPTSDIRNQLFSINLPRAIVQENGTSKRSTVRTINVLGAKRVAILIERAPTGPTAACVIGWFGR